MGEALGDREGATDQRALRDDRDVGDVCAGVPAALVAVEAWYEWVKRDGQTIPHALARADRAPTALGGIWECWRSPIGDRMLTLAIVTTPAAAGLTTIHDRMPLVLAEPHWPIWLGEAEGDAAALMRPAPSGSIATWRVGRAVGNPRNNGAEVLAAA